MKKADIPAIEGKRILGWIRQRKHNPGGKTVEITGAQGSGKTSMLHWFAEDIVQRLPKETLFWREGLGNPLQFINNSVKWRILVEKGTNFHIVDKNNGGSEANFRFHEFDKVPKVSYDVQKIEKDEEFRSKNNEKMEQQNDIFKQLIGMTKDAHLNVVYFRSPFTWVDLIRYCRAIPGWQTFLVDEYEDLFPFYNTGELWKRVEWTKNNFKHIRKGHVNAIFNSQKKTDVDWRIRSKMDIWAYFFGAVVDEISPIKKEAVGNLKVGQGWLDWGRSRYGKIKFKPYHADENVFLVGEMD